MMRWVALAFMVGAELARPAATEIARPAATAIAQGGASSAPAIDWKTVEEETMRHFQAIVRFDTTAKERPAAEYIKKVLDDNGIPAQMYSLEPDRPSVQADPSKT